MEKLCGKSKDMERYLIKCLYCFFVLKRLNLKKLVRDPSHCGTPRRLIRSSVAEVLQSMEERRVDL